MGTLEHLFEAPIVVLDTETTGLLADDWAAIVEIGAVCLDVDGQEIDTFQILVCPDILDERANNAFTVNKISAHDITTSGIPTVEARHQFENWLAGHGLPLLAAYGRDFDRGMLERMGFGLCEESLWWLPCIMQAAKAEMVANGQTPWLGRRWPFPRLTTETAPFFGVVPTTPAHRALSDAQTAAAVVVEMKRRAAGRIVA